MKVNLRHIPLPLVFWLAALPACAQKFYNLTAQDVRVDSVIPVFSHTESLPSAFSDSTYTFEIAYPEYVDMPAADVANYRRISAVPPPASPAVETSVVFDRKRPSLLASFCPVVCRRGKWQVLASFMLRRVASPKTGAGEGSVVSRIARLNSPYGPAALSAADASAVAPADRYAAQSVLRSGRWAKIRVPQTGIYQLTDAVVRQAGFSDPSRVKVYGYGGNLISEVLNADDLVNGDDLKEVPTCSIGGRRLFYGCGPVSWTANGTSRRTRNPYSDYGYYFLTESDGEPLSVDSAAFVGSFYPSPDWYHDIHEVDGYSYFQGGRNLFDSRETAVGDSIVLSFDAPEDATAGSLTVAVASSGSATVSVSVNGVRAGTLNIRSGDTSYKHGFQNSNTFAFVPGGSGAAQKVVVAVSGGNPVRLDFASVAWNRPHRLPDLSSATFAAPEYVYNITNQNHHADPQADMVIIIPTSQKLLAQAQRLKKLHEDHDAMRVNIVPADELFNEFSSGTPDASAYRRYLKMLYDRASGEADQPKYLLLFGGSVWDNRLKTPACSGLSADDLLLAYEGEESFDARSSVVDDGFYTMLDDGEGARPLTVDKFDVAVGRIPVTAVADAKAVVDKVERYVTDATGGPWLNTIFFMGDDGDKNEHMNNANTVADQVIAAHPAYLVKKTMWDAYKRESSASGYTYPEVSKAIIQQQQQGALIMNYVGHGSEWQFSHENVLHINDFSTFTNTNLPLWATIGCDFAPFDRLADNIGMKALLNSVGGAVAVLGTTRTVTSNYNHRLNSAFMRHVLTFGDDGKPIAVGEALRRARNESDNDNLSTNSRQYVLLGDPAMPLNLPTATAVIDSIDGIRVGDGSRQIQMKAGALVTVKGHIDNMPDFEGEVTLLVRDSRETVTCRDNADDVDTPFTYTDRTKTIYSGKNRVAGGQFGFTFAVPKDINYSDESGLVTAWAISDDHSSIAHGYSDAFTVGGSAIAANDSIGPSIFCYLNSPSFQNGGSVNPTPYFVAEVNDRDGINASGSGIGHDMQLVVDGMADMTYSLNDNFAFDFGSYTSGSTYYNLPELSEGEHTLVFRAWDIQNNMSQAQLRFNVAKSLKPSFSIACTDNPASASTTFVITHDRAGSELDVTVEVFDTSGRMLWSHSESGTSAGSSYTVDWDLTASNGSRLQPGVYLYRVKLGSDSAVRTSKAKKLIVVGNK